jgi:hypothetical protein
LIVIARFKTSLIGITLHILLDKTVYCLVEFDQSFFKFGNPTKLSKHKKEQKVDPLHNKYQDPNEWRISKLKKPKKGN